MNTAEETQSLPSVYEWHARCLEEAGRNLAHWVGTTKEEKLDWQPQAVGEESKARSVYDQVHECAQVNRRFGRVLQGLENGPWVEAHPYTSSADAQADLRASAKELADVVRNLDDGALTREYQTRMGVMTGAMFLSIALGNLYYHGGQVNQIQLLYGDTEFHFPQGE